MRYPIVIESGNENQAFGVVVPDLPDCFSAGGTRDEAIDNAKEAIELWLETTIDDGGIVPEASNISSHQSNPEFAGWIWTVVDIDLAEYLINPSASHSHQEYCAVLMSQPRQQVNPDPDISLI